MTTSSVIGVVGLGRTGMPVAQNLIARGHRVVGYRRSDASALVYAGGSVAGSARDVAVRATTILTVLPSAAALHEVITGMLPALGEHHVVIELGSHPPADKERQRAACAGRGATFLDGEISGTPAMVAARRAVLLVAGERAASEAALAVCRDVTDHARYAGAFGAATQLKLVANLLVAVHTAAAAEAMLLVERAGLDPALAIDVLGLGAGGSTMFATRAPAMTARRFGDPAPGPVAMLAHYLAPIEALARASRAPIPMFEIAAELYRAALADGRADQDIACVIELLDAQKGPPS